MRGSEYPSVSDASVALSRAKIKESTSCLPTTRELSPGDDRVVPEAERGDSEHITQHLRSGTRAKDVRRVLLPPVSP